MRPNWPQLANLAQNTLHLSCSQFVSAYIALNVILFRSINPIQLVLVPCASYKISPRILPYCRLIFLVLCNLWACSGIIFFIF